MHDLKLWLSLRYRYVVVTLRNLLTCKVVSVGRGVGWLFLRHKKRLSMHFSFLQGSLRANLQHIFALKTQGFCEKRMFSFR